MTATTLHNPPVAHRNPWAIYGWWVGLQALIAIGLLLLIAAEIVPATNTALNQAGLTLYDLLTAAALALAQGGIIARVLPIRAWVWTAVTFAAFLGATFLNGALGFALSQFSNNFFALIAGFLFLLILGYPLMGGLIPGAAQALLLRPHTTHALRWLGMVILAHLGVGYIGNLILLGLSRPPGPDNQPGLLTGNLALASVSCLTVLATAALTGLALVYFLRHPRPKQLMGTSDPVPLLPDPGR